ncbi:acetyl-CoA carboxylase biotin carboxyl carrier protein [Nonomuraea sp. NPDC047897]|uniref:acetyl-CoA carboxylase biotin carboxyl carrier protein n=1 Tax=Nonomuraea sp. NPDC047897 TaxID=3364346 RepID=UPI00371626DB
MDDVTGAASHALLGELCRRAVELVNAGGAGMRRVRLQSGDAVVELEWPEPAPAAAHPGPAVPGPPGDAPAGSAVPAGSAGQPGDAAGTGTAHEVGAPVVGTFYRAPEPGAPPFVSVGDVVEKGQQVGIVEAMKLMNPVEADRSGRVLAVVVPDGTHVEYGQTLLTLDPEEAP